jgi:hypothetical protein
MNRIRAAILTGLVVVVGGCTENTPTDVSTVDAPQFAPVPRNALLTNLPVTGVLQNVGSLVGTVDITSFDVDDDGDLMVTGELTGTVRDAAGNVVRTLTDAAFSAPADLVRAHHSKCDLLFLQLGPLDLDLLGLVLDLSQITLDLDAVSGAGNLLGNLLCGLVGLLDGVGLIGAITDLLDRINDLLG